VDQLELLTFGFLRRLSAIIHRTVRCDTRLSGVPSGATIASATVDSNGRLTQQTVRAELEQHQKAHQTVRWPRLSELQRLNPNGWVTWLAHRTIQCAHRHQPNPNDWFGGWGYKYPQPPPLQGIQVFSHCIQYKSSRLHSKTQINRSNPLQVKIHSKHLVASEREIFVFI
jgi:hypothetical protein